MTAIEVDRLILTECFIPELSFVQEVQSQWQAFADHYAGKNN